MFNYFIVTFGCQMNKNDSERIDGMCESLGFKKIDSAKNADLIIVNTCSVRQSAEDRVFGYIHNWQKLRTKNPNLIIAVTGCMPGRDKNGRIKKRIKGIDLFFGIDQLVMLPKWIKQLNPKMVNLVNDELTDYIDIKPINENKYQAYITIQTGCNNYCTYCVVPYARGKEKNRELKDVLSEIRHLVRKGTIEFTLLGQVVNNYKINDRNSINKENPFKDDFAILLWEINNIKGVKRIHFTASDPQYFSDEQVKALSLSNVANFLHLPVQSGNDEILKKMNRKYTAEYFLNLVDKIKKEKPDIAIGTDFIVGFCGETEKQFLDTVELYNKCQFDISYPAVYSQRSGTPASKAFKDDISYDTKKKRWKCIQDLMEEFAYKKNQKYLNQEVDVMVEDYVDGINIGRSSEMKLVHFLSKSNEVGKIVRVKVTFTDTWLLKGIKV